MVRWESECICSLCGTASVTGRGGLFHLVITHILEEMGTQISLQVHWKGTRYEAVHLFLPSSAPNDQHGHGSTKTRATFCRCAAQLLELIPVLSFRYELEYWCVRTPSSYRLLDSFLLFYQLGPFVTWLFAVVCVLKFLYSRRRLGDLYTGDRFMDISI